MGHIESVWALVDPAHEALRLWLSAPSQSSIAEPALHTATPIAGGSAQRSVVASRVDF